MEEISQSNSSCKVKKFKQTLILEKLEMKYEKLKKRQLKKLSKDLLNLSNNSTLEHNLPNESFCAKSVQNQNQISTNSILDNKRAKPSRLKNTNVKFLENVSVATNNTNSDTISNNYSNVKSQNNTHTNSSKVINSTKENEISSFNRKANLSKSSNLNSLRTYIETENCLSHNADYIIKKVENENDNENENENETKNEIKGEIIHKRLKTNQSKTTNVSKDVSPNKPNTKNLRDKNPFSGKNDKKLNFFEYPNSNISNFVSSNSNVICKVEESDSLNQKIPTKPKHKNSLSCFSFFCN